MDEISLKGLWTKAQWEKELINKKQTCLGIIKSSDLIAFCCGWEIIDELHITAIAVHPQHRRQGFGKVILSKMFLQAKKNGVKSATLEVDSSNKLAILFYKRMGFQVAGCRKNYYRTGGDCLIHWKSI